MTSTRDISRNRSDEICCVFPKQSQEDQETDLESRLGMGEERGGGNVEIIVDSLA